MTTRCIQLPMLRRMSKRINKNVFNVGKMKTESPTHTYKDQRLHTQFDPDDVTLAHWNDIKCSRHWTLNIFGLRLETLAMTFSRSLSAECNIIWRERISFVQWNRIKWHSFIVRNTFLWKRRFIQNGHSFSSHTMYHWLTSNAFIYQWI